MKLLPAFLFLSIALLPPAALAKKAATEYPATYAGGSLPLDHHKVRAALGKDEESSCRAAAASPFRLRTLPGSRAPPSGRLSSRRCSVDAPRRERGSLHRSRLDRRQRKYRPRASALEVEPRRISRLSRGAGTGDRHQGGQHQSSADRSPIRDLSRARLLAPQRYRRVHARRASCWNKRRQYRKACQPSHG